MAMTAKDVEDQDTAAIHHMIKHYQTTGDVAKEALYRSLLEESE